MTHAWYFLFFFLLYVSNFLRKTSSTSPPPLVQWAGYPGSVVKYLNVQIIFLRFPFDVIHARQKCIALLWMLLLYYSIIVNFSVLINRMNLNEKNVSLVINHTQKLHRCFASFPISGLPLRISRPSSYFTMNFRIT